MSHAFECFSCMLSLTNLVAVQLSVVIIVVGCWCPIESRVCRMWRAIWALMNALAVSTSDVEETTCHMVSRATKIGVLTVGGPLKGLLDR